MDAYVVFDPVTHRDVRVEVCSRREFEPKRLAYAKKHAKFFAEHKFQAFLFRGCTSFYDEIPAPHGNMQPCIVTSLISDCPHELGHHRDSPHTSYGTFTTMNPIRFLRWSDPEGLINDWAEMWLKARRV